MALAIDASTPARTAGGTATQTTASFTPPANSILVACACSDGTGAIAFTFSDSLTGTWTEQVHRDGGDVGGLNGAAGIATRIIGASQAMTASFDAAGNVQQSLKVYVVTGQHATAPIGAVGENSSNTNDITPNAYTSTAANSRGFGCADDWNANGLPTSTDTEDAFHIDGWISGLSLFKAADTATSGTVVAMNFDAAGTAAAVWNWVALEILPAAGGTDHTVTQTDSAGLTDTTALIVSPVVTDSAGLTDVALVEPSKLVTQTDSAGLSDAAAFTQSNVVTDSAGLSDASLLTQATVLTDSAGLADTSTVQSAKAVTQTDSAGLTDGQAFSQSYTLADSAGLTDAATLTISKIATDSAGLIDAASVGLLREQTVTDSAGLADAAVVFDRSLGLTDLVGLVDAVALAQSRVYTDSAGLTDGFVTSSFDPITNRPNTGTTARLNTGSTARPSTGTTARMNTGTTARPNTGSTARP